MNEFQKRKEDKIRAAMNAECVKLEDGYYYWWPLNLGTFSPSDLRLMADVIDEMNADWDKQVMEEIGAD